MELPSLGDFYWPVIGTIGGAGLMALLFACHRIYAGFRAKARQIRQEDDVHIFDDIRLPAETRLHTIGATTVISQSHGWPVAYTAPALPWDEIKGRK